MLTGIGFLGVGIILVILGFCLYAGVIFIQIPLLGFIAWIPMGLGGLFVIIGLVLIVLRR